MSDINYKFKSIKLNKHLNHHILFFICLIITSTLYNKSLSTSFLLELNTKDKDSTEIKTIPTDEPSEVCSAGIAAAHSPYGEETEEMRYDAVLIFGFLSISIMLIRSLARIICSGFSKFNQQTIKLIFRYTFLYLILLGIVTILYAISEFDSYKFNLEGMLLGFYVLLAALVM